MDLSTGRHIHNLRAWIVPTGTGCRLSAALAAALAHGAPLPETVATAKRYLQDRLAAGGSDQSIGAWPCASR